MLRRRPARRPGSALIITLGMLFVLAFLAIAFSRVMIPERDAAHQYHLTVQAKMAAEAGVERATAELLGSLRSGTFRGRFAAWRYFGEDGNRNYIDDPGEDANFNGLVERSDCPLLEAQAPSLQVAGTDYSGEIATPIIQDDVYYRIRYKLKIVDAESMINLNNDYPGFERFLDNFGLTLESYLGLGRDLVAGCSFGGNTGAAAILAYRATLPGGVFSTKRQIVPLLQRGEEDYEFISPYITAFGWEQQDAYIEQGVSASGENFWRNLSGWRWWDPANTETYRCFPININTASEPVLAACFAEIQGHYPHATTWGVPYDGRRLRMPSDYKFYLWTITTPMATARALARIVIAYRQGNESDTNEDGWPDPPEDTNGNGYVDKGPFRNWQEVDHLLQSILTYPSVTRAAINPNAQLMRTNPDYMPTAWTFDEAWPLRSANKAYIMWEDTFLSDKGYVNRIPPQLTLHSHGQYEVTSLGYVVNDQDQMIASKEIRTVFQLYHPIRHSTQQDFMSKPDGSPWTAGQTPPTTPWTDAEYQANCINTTSFPENVRDNDNGSKSVSDPSKADPTSGGVQLAPMDFQRGGERFFASYNHSHDAETGQAAGPGSSTAPNSPIDRIEDTSVHGGLNTSSDLFSDGTYGSYGYGYSRGRTRSNGYTGASNVVNPNQGTLELWHKHDSQISAGEIFTAWHPAAPTIKNFSTEGIEFRVFLGYVPMAAGFGGVIPVDRPYRWWSRWELHESAGVYCVPALVAMRRYYTSIIGDNDGVIYGRDTGFGAYWVTNFIDYEYVPLHLNEGRDGWWHHLRVTWRNGTDLEFYVDGRRAPYAFTRSVAQWAGQSNVLFSYWPYPGVYDEAFVGGFSKREWLNYGGAFLSWDGAFGYSGGAMNEFDHMDDMWWADGPSGADWHNDGTIDWVRTYDQYGVAGTLDRFEPIAANYVGAYRNTMKLPEDARRIVAFAWNEYIPTWSPALDNGPWHFGSYLYPDERPDIDIDLTVNSTTTSLTPLDGSGASLDIGVTGGEIVTYTAYFRNPNGTTPLMVSPILEDVLLIYTTGGIEYLIWEEY